MKNLIGWKTLGLGGVGIFLGLFIKKTFNIYRIIQRYKNVAGSKNKTGFVGNQSKH
jgi:hypothetical protein